MKDGTEKAKTSVTNLRKAFDTLTRFLDEKVESERDRAGVIQAFEFTFELFWKTFHKIAEEEGINAPGPKQSLQAGLQLGFIPIETEKIWLAMLTDRNLTTHIYHSKLSDEIFSRIKEHYYPAFQVTLEKIEASLKPG